MSFALFVTTSAFLLGPSTPPLMSTARRPLIAVVMDEQQQQQKRTDIDVTAAKTSLLDKLKGGGDRLASMLRRGGEKEALTSSEKFVCGKNKYGCDPRFAPEPVAMREAERKASELKPGESWPLLVPGEVGELIGGVAHLDALLADAAANGNRAVVLKFKRDGCPACNSTIAPLASAAQAYSGRADFCTVDYNAWKGFCRRSAIKVVPCAHIYVDGELLETMPLGPRKWPEFATRMEEIVGQPDGEVLAAEIPEAKYDHRAVTGLV